MKIMVLLLVGRRTADTLLTELRVSYIQISHCSNERGNEGMVVYPGGGGGRVGCERVPGFY